MKNVFLSLSAVLVLSVFFAFSWNTNPYENLVEADLKSEFVSHTSSDQLIENLSAAFPHLLDKIDRVDIHISEEHGYYYSAYGQLEGNADVFFINVTEEMAAKEAFPTLKEMNIEANNLAAATCYWNRGILGISVCTRTLARRVCGFTVFGVCTPFDIIPI